MSASWASPPLRCRPKQAVRAPSGASPLPISLYKGDAARTPGARAALCYTAAAMSETASRPTPGHRVGMISLGCAKNLVDSEVMLGELARQGYEVVSDLE